MKNILTILIVVAVLVGAYFLFKKVPTESSANTEMSSYFQERMDTLGVNEGFGRPIEGFDADLLISSFPGLQNTDFLGVETFEGYYEVTNGELSFVRDMEQPISTAEKTVSEKGYATLLENLSKRLNITADTRERVDQIIDTVDTSDIISVGLNNTASKFGIELTPLSVLEDSRCPQDVICIQAGTVILRTKVQSGSSIATSTFQLDQATTTFSHGIKLIRVDPPTLSTGKITSGDYLFFFEVTK